MQSEFDVQAPCLCCDRLVYMRSQDWSPYTAAVCMQCYRSTPFYVLRSMFVLRTQMANLANRVVESERRMGLLFAAQEELEEKLNGT